MISFPHSSDIQESPFLSSPHISDFLISPSSFLLRTPAISPSQVMALLLVWKIEVIRKEMPHVSTPTPPHLSTSVPTPSAFSSGLVDKFSKWHLGTSPLLHLRWNPLFLSLLLKNMATVIFHSHLYHCFLLDLLYKHEATLWNLTSENTSVDHLTFSSLLCSISALVFS